MSYGARCRCWGARALQQASVAFTETASLEARDAEEARKGTDWSPGTEAGEVSAALAHLGNFSLEYIYYQDLRWSGLFLSLVLNCSVSWLHTFLIVLEQY